jgi:PKD repeat protein
MKKIKKILISLSAISILFLGGATLSDITSNTAHAKDYCAEHSNNIIQCPTDELSFTQFKGELVQIDGAGYDDGITRVSSVREMIQKVVNYALTFLGLVATLIIIYAGVMYVTAAGQTEQTDKAKKTIGYTVAGLLLIISSYAIVNTVLTGPFSEQDEAQSITGRIGVEGFNASTSELFKSAENMILGYKYLIETIESVKSLETTMESSSLGGPIGGRASRTSILQFLTTLKIQLQSVKSAAPAFSGTATFINEYIREINNWVDRIEGLSEVKSVRIGGSLECGDADASKCESLLVDSNGDTIHDIWEGYKQDLSYQSGSPYEIRAVVEKAKEDFAGPMVNGAITDFVNLDCSVQEYLDNPGTSFTSSGWSEARPKGLMAEEYCVLKGVYENVSGIEDVLGDTAIPEIQNALASLFASLASEVWGPTFYDDQNVGNELIVNVIQTEDELAKAIKNVKFVKTILAASASEGSAPLIVNFDVLNSADPSGDSIDPDNVDWDLLGNGFTNLAGGQDVDADCYKTFNPNSPGEVISEAFGRGETTYCVYSKPGTYRASARIDSSDPDKYAPGFSSIDIKVYPPKTQIALKAVYGDTTEWLIDYGQAATTNEFEGVVLVNKDSIRLTKSQARNIEFNASETENLGGQKGRIINYKWSFGDGDNQEGPQLSSVDKAYAQEGVYGVMLEVFEEDGNTAKKIFKVIVGSPAAKINMSPKAEEYKLGEIVTLDGSRSKTDVGQINSYKWEIYHTSRTGSKILMELDDDSSEIVKYEFKVAGEYELNLTVVDTAGGKDVSTLNFSVTSQPPIPLFEYSMLDASQPSKVYFDASKSYDPDPAYEEYLESVSEILYLWEINGEIGDKPGVIDYTTNAKNVETNEVDEAPSILFGKKGEYEVTLYTWNPGEDEGEENPSITKTIIIDDTLDIAWSDENKYTEFLGESGQVEMNFSFESANATAYEVDFGDGQTAIGEFTTDVGVMEQRSITHKYNSADKFTLQVTVYDNEDNGKIITKKVFIGGGDAPIAKISLKRNGEKYEIDGDTIELTRADVMTFDASESVNIDGTGRDLEYRWDFGDGSKSSKKSTPHIFKELSPELTEDVQGYFTVKLKVNDKDDKSLQDDATLKVKVVSAPPQFSSLQVIPASNEDMITPTTLTVKAFGAKDPDGQITKYKWWYYDIYDPDNILGIRVTQKPSTVMTLGTKGNEGEEKTYGFGLEITDNDDIKVNSEDQIDEDKIPQITVSNGPNKIPLAKFKVDRTTVYVNEAVNFSSASSDADGDIVEYVWDVEGDGFFNNEPTDLSTISHTFTEKNLDGYKVRLKVIDDKYGEAVSSPVTIFVDSLAKAPKAAFKYSSAGGKTIVFENNSEADDSVEAELTEYLWDFDTASQFSSSDSDGDGVRDNDVDSNEKDPVFTYNEYGIYQVKLTVKDDQGNTKTVKNMVSVSALGGEGGVAEISGLDANSDGPLGLPQTQPTTIDLDAPPSGNSETPATQEPALKAVMTTNPPTNNAGTVAIGGETGSVTFDFSQSVGDIAYYILDKNIYFDTNGDTVKNNDQDFKTVLPGEWTANFEKAWGQIVVKLTVVDIHGNTDTAVQEITFQ